MDQRLNYGSLQTDSSGGEFGRACITDTVVDMLFVALKLSPLLT